MKNLTHLPFRLAVIWGLALLMVSGCSNYNKLLKSGDVPKKLEAAIKYYEKGDYIKAQTLFDELSTVYRGTANAEKVLYYYAYTNYNLSDYALAAFQFKTYVLNYPLSTKKEECAYMAAACYERMSPGASLDQTETKNAINEYQLFVNQFPASAKVKEANEAIDRLRKKLERKNYDIAKQYYFIQDYKAALVAFKNFLKEFPETTYREEVQFLSVKSSYLYALNSIESKKAERYKVAADTYLKFIDFFPKSKYLREAENIYQDIQKAQLRYQP